MTLLFSSYRVPNSRSTRQQPATNRRCWPSLRCHARSGDTSRLSVHVRATFKAIWLQTSDKATFMTALESGHVSAFVFGPDPEHQALASTWSTLGRFYPLSLDTLGVLTEAVTGRTVGEVVAVDGPEAARSLETRVQHHYQQLQQQQRRRQLLEAERQTAADPGGGASSRDEDREWALVLDAKDWKVIPAENLVALIQPPADAPKGLSSGTALSSPALRLMAAAGSAEEARLMMEALEAGTGGVLLRTNDPVQVRTLLSYVSRRAAEESSRPEAMLRYAEARVVGVRLLGLGDRACVDLAGLMQPGEGLLVGSFARCLALVHSECGESPYIASRPFRVNAGPVHAYVYCPGGRTRYLSELSTGMEVLVADPSGRYRTALVGRVKIERRPLVLVELETRAGPEGEMCEGGREEVARHSLMLQNAETVKLVGPAKRQQQCFNRTEQQQKREGRDERPQIEQGEVGLEKSGDSVGGGQVAWRTVSVSDLQPGDLVNVVLQPAARHTGIVVEEFIVEK